jgi:IS30 family transposase
MNHYRHLSLEERERTFGLKEQGLSFREIARVLGRHHTTLSREYGRHAKYGRGYLPCRAQTKAELKAVRQRTKAPLKNPLVFVYAREKLRAGWSPETIAGRLSIDHPGETICPETIYRYVYSSRKTYGMKLWRYLKLHRKRRMKKHGRKVQSPTIENVFRIDKRPRTVEKRRQAGHWETDNLGSPPSDRRAVSLLVERKMRFNRLALLPDRTAATKAKKVNQALLKFPEEMRKTITADNGRENADHENITAVTGAKVFFCLPYHSWEKGTVENRFGAVRRFIPKGTSLDTVTPRQIKIIERKLNSTPMKCLGWLTPYEKMREELNKLGYSGGALQV